MASLSFDGQSLILDGRRTWLVSGAIHYARVPHQLWRSRIRAAKQAGLNCIETVIFWNVHEPRKGRFHFTGDADIRRFVRMIGEEGMFCMLRPGPYVCAEWDFGGFPPWLKLIEGMRYRQQNEPFLQATARYFRAVMEQVADLQITAPVVPGQWTALSQRQVNHPANGFVGNGGGPIVLMQVENEWLCQNPDGAQPYFQSLVSQLRQYGCTVPLTNCNNLWQPVEGTFSTWNANRNLASDLRQLALVQPDALRLVSEFWPGWFQSWNQTPDQAAATDMSAAQFYHRLAQIFAGGSQCNFYMFHGGTNFGFHGGRTIGRPDHFITTSYDYDAPLKEAGDRGRKYQLAKRLCMFASQFGQLFAHADATAVPATVAPDDEMTHPLSIQQLSGSQGDIVFLLRGGKARASTVNLLLPNGLTLPVPLGTEPVSWLTLHAKLGGVAVLDYTNLQPWAFVANRMLLLFGPAKADGIVSINAATYVMKVPAGKQPHVEIHEDITVVVLNEEQIDAAYLVDDGLMVGIDGVDDEGNPLPLRGWATMHHVQPDGRTTSRKLRRLRKPVAPKLTPWSRAVDPAWQCAHADNTEDQREAADHDEHAQPPLRFQPLDGPTSLEQAGVYFGYGWYRLNLSAPRQGNIVAPNSGDRLHVYQDGRLQTILGLGPAAVYDPVKLKLKGDVLILADNLGRCNFGNDMPDPKGLCDHLYECKPVKLNKPTITQQPAPDVFELGDYFTYYRKGDQPMAQALSWQLRLTVRQSLLLDIAELPVPALLLINDQPVQLYDTRAGVGLLRRTLHANESPCQSGRNTVTLALMKPLEKQQLAQISRFVRLYAINAVTDGKTQWSFAACVPPADDAFSDLPATTPSQPCWYRAGFNATATALPLWLEPRGMSKGQLYLNGYNVGRYFVATHTGKNVPPQQRYYLPQPWIQTDAPNELLLFDEHGKHPDQCRLVYE